LQAGLVTNTAASETIKQREYVYAYDDEAKGLDDDIFVICTDCPDSRLNQIYTIATRYSIDPQKGTVPRTEEKISAKQEEPVQPKILPENKILGIIRFPFDSYVLSRKSITQLDGIEHTNKRVRVEGFTCTEGTDRYNLKLSQRRAKTVADYLKSRGISVLNYSGLGESTKYKDKPSNRRVEIIEGKGVKQE
jgi:outer membrane protein OmpA-like peptidoglycan-associated protein